MTTLLTDRSSIQIAIAQLVAEENGNEEQVQLLRAELFRRGTTAERVILRRNMK